MPKFPSYEWIELQHPTLLVPRCFRYFRGVRPRLHRVGHGHVAQGVLRGVLVKGGGQLRPVAAGRYRGDTLPRAFLDDNFAFARSRLQEHTLCKSVTFLCYLECLPYFFPSACVAVSPFPRQVHSYSNVPYLSERHDC